MALYSLLAAELPLLAGYRPENPVTIAAFVVFLAVLLVKRDETLSLVGRLVTSRAVLYAVFGIMFAGWAAAAAVDFYALEISNFDTGIYLNGILNFLSSGRYYSTILGKHALSNHFSPNMLFLAPLVEEFPGAGWLLAAKIAAFLSSTWILLRLGSAALGADNPWRYAAPILWLMHGYVGNTLASEFQPSSLALPFILLAFLHAFEGQFVILSVVCIFLLGFKEHLGLVLVCVGIFLAVERGRPRTGAAFALCGAAAGALIYFVIMPSFGSDGGLSHIHRFSPFELVPEKIRLLALALVSVGLLPLLRPRSLLYIVPAFALALVANDKNMTGFSFHYQDVPLAVLFVGVVMGMRHLKEGTSVLSRSSPAFRARLACLAIVCVLAVNTTFPAKVVRKHFPSAEDLETLREIGATNKIFASPSRIWTNDALGPYLTGASDLHSIIDKTAVFEDPRERFVLISREVNPWPLKAEDVEGIQKRLREVCTEKRGFKHFQAFHCPPE